MVAASWNKDELFRKMMDEDSTSVHKTLFQAAKLPDLNTIRVSEYLSSVYVFCTFLLNVMTNMLP